MPVGVDSFVFDRFSQANTGQIVARRREHAIGEAEFRARVSAWRNTFDAIHNTVIALYDPDGIEFAAALIGAW